MKYEVSQVMRLGKVCHAMAAYFKQLLDEAEHDIKNVVVKNKMAERFAEVNEQEIRELLDNTTPKIPCLSI